MNPLRYRGYYYSDELGLYYLKSRFYDPEVGRFISADTVDYLAPDTINGLNLYAYCRNNPVMNVDPSGHSLTAVLIALAVGAIIGFGGTMAVDYYDDGQIFNGSISVGSYVLNTLTVAAIFGLFAYIGTTSFTFTLPEFQLMELVFGGAELVVVSTTTVTVSGTAVLGALGIGIGILFSKPSTGRIRFQDGTGIDPDSGHPVEDKDIAYKIYKKLK